MPRKKTVENIEPKGVYLSEGQYYKWRLTIEELDHAKTLQSKASLEFKIKQLEYENASLRVRVSTDLLRNGKEGVSIAEKEYQRVKAEIEGALAISLNDKMIDPYTYQVKDVPKQP